MPLPPEAGSVGIELGWGGRVEGVSWWVWRKGGGRVVVKVQRNNSPFNLLFALAEEPSQLVLQLIHD